MINDQYPMINDQFSMKRKQQPDPIRNKNLWVTVNDQIPRMFLTSPLIIDYWPLVIAH